MFFRRRRIEDGPSWHAECFIGIIAIISLTTLSPLPPSSRPRLLARLVAPVVAILIAVAGQTNAAIINAASPALVDVASAVTLASDGDTVVVPAGTATWNSTLFINKGITLRGATTVDTSSGLGTTNDQTVIVDGSSATLLTGTFTPSQSFRLTGFTFRKGTSTTVQGVGVGLGGTCPSVRVDHCHFDQIYRNDQFNPHGWIYGVIDHCKFDSVNGAVAIHVAHDTWNNTQYGDGSWADSPYFGSEKFIFIEDNIFNTLAGVNGNIDCNQGGRYVARYNSFFNSCPATHGNDSGGRARSSRALEFYNNTINYTFAWPGNQIRGGTAVLHHNTLTGSVTGLMALKCYRTWLTFAVFGCASGHNGFDSNDPNALYASGTAASPTTSGDTSTITDTTKSWAVNQWANYSLTNTATEYGSYVISNTAHTITYDSAVTSGGNSLSFTAGQGYQIYKVLIPIDQPGRGKGDLLSGSTPVNSTTGTAAWPNQGLEPAYAWNNTLNGNNLHITGGGPTLKEGRDFYNDTPMPGYTPYVYPHPLVSGVPAAPTNLRIASGP